MEAIDSLGAGGAMRKDNRNAARQRMSVARNSGLDRVTTTSGLNKSVIARKTGIHT